MDPKSKKLLRKDVELFICCQQMEDNMFVLLKNFETFILLSQRVFFTEALTQMLNNNCRLFGQQFTQQIGIFFCLKMNVIFWTKIFKVLLLIEFELKSILGCFILQKQEGGKDGEFFCNCILALKRTYIRRDSDIQGVYLWLDKSLGISKSLGKKGQSHLPIQ